jgi:purine-binding chemotaxis protein CheW
MATQSIKDIVSSVASATEEEKKKAVDYTQLVIFELDDEEYAVAIEELQEIIKIPEITPIPNAPEFIRGILNLRGKIVVVVDLEKRFHLERSKPSEPMHITVAEVGGNTFGIIVDQVTEVIRVPISLIQPTPSLVSSKIGSEYLKGVIVLEGDVVAGSDDEKTAQTPAKKVETRLLILLDVPKMLQEEEFLNVERVIHEVTEQTPVQAEASATDQSKAPKEPEVPVV